MRWGRFFGCDYHAIDGLCPTIPLSLWIFDGRKSFVGYFHSPIPIQYVGDVNDVFDASGVNYASVLSHEIVHSHYRMCGGFYYVACKHRNGLSLCFLCVEFLPFFVGWFWFNFSPFACFWLIWRMTVYRARSYTMRWNGGIFPWRCRSNRTRTRIHTK